MTHSHHKTSDRSNLFLITPQATLRRSQDLSRLRFFLRPCPGEWQAA